VALSRAEGEIVERTENVKIEDWEVNWEGVLDGDDDSEVLLRVGKGD